jgi:hypothetical protein
MDADPVSSEVARAAAGMRLVVTDGVPNPWSEAAKGMIYVKGIDHLRVKQMPGDTNDALRAWTGLNSSPVAVWNDEPPRHNWADLVVLFERVAREPPLIPPEEADRAAMFGLMHALCSEDGFGWNRRLYHFNTLPDVPELASNEGLKRMRAKYGHGGSLDHCRKRMIAVLTMLGERLRAQKDSGSVFYFGNAPVALDIYSACFMAMVRPLPLDLCPTSPELHDSYTLKDDAVLAAVDPLLLNHRDMLYDNWLELPMRL